MLNCDPETGVCSLPEVFDKPASQKPVETVTEWSGTAVLFFTRTANDGKRETDGS